MAFVTKDELTALVGKEIGVSDWIDVPQERITKFAEATEDYQFIHIDPERSAKETPFGGTIAHGFLTLSLLSRMAENVAVALEGIVMGINYGLDKVRFLHPVPSGSRVRGRFVLAEARERHPGQWLIKYSVTVEIEGNEKPAMLAEWLAIQVIG